MPRLPVDLMGESAADNDSCHNVHDSATQLSDALLVSFDLAISAPMSS